MSTTKRIAKNSLYNLLTSIVSKGITMAIIILLARNLGAEAYGAYSFVLGFVGLFAVFGDFGLTILLKRTVAREPDKVNQHFNTAMIISTGLNIAMLGIMLIAAKVLSYDAATIKLLFIGGVFIIFQNLKLLFKSTYEAYEKMGLVFVSRSIKMVLRLSLVIYLVATSITLIKLFTYYALLEIAMMAVDFTIYHNYIHHFAIKTSKIKPIVISMIPFGVAGLFMTIYDKVDITLLSKLLPSNPHLYIGWYSSAYELMSALIFIPAAISSAIMPVAYKSDKEGLKKLYKSAFSSFISIALAICVGTTILADKIINLIYGPEFSGSVIALQILIWALVFNFAMFVTGIVLNSINLEKETMKATIISVIFNIITNIIFIPRYGYLAAAYTTLGSVFLYNAYCFYITEKRFAKLPYFKLLWKGILSTILMGIVVYFTQDIFILSIIAGSITFFGLMLFLRGFDFQIIKQVLAKTK